MNRYLEFVAGRARQGTLQVLGIASAPAHADGMVHIAPLAKHLSEKLAALTDKVAGYIKAHPRLEFGPPVISAEQNFKSSGREPEAKPKLEHGRQVELEPAKAGIEIGPGGMRGFLRAPELVIREPEPEEEREAGG